MAAGAGAGAGASPPLMYTTKLSCSVPPDAKEAPSTFPYSKYPLTGFKIGTMDINDIEIFTRSYPKGASTDKYYQLLLDSTCPYILKPLAKLERGDRCIFTFPKVIDCTLEAFIMHHKDALFKGKPKQGGSIHNIQLDYCDTLISIYRQASGALDGLHKDDKVLAGQFDLSNIFLQLGGFRPKVFVLLPMVEAQAQQGKAIQIHPWTEAGNVADWKLFGGYVMRPCTSKIRMNSTNAVEVYNLILKLESGDITRRGAHDLHKEIPLNFEQNKLSFITNSYEEVLKKHSREFFKKKPTTEHKLPRLFKYRPWWSHFGHLLKGLPKFIRQRYMDKTDPDNFLYIFLYFRNTVEHYGSSYYLKCQFECPGDFVRHGCELYPAFYKHLKAIVKKHKGRKLIASLIEGEGAVTRKLDCIKIV